MVGGEVNGRSPEGWRQAILNAALILTHGNELLRSTLPNRVPHGACPLGERFLRKQEIVMDTERVCTRIHASGIKLCFCRKRNQSADRIGRHIPQRSEPAAIRVVGAYPAVPHGVFNWIAI